MSGSIISISFLTLSIREKSSASNAKACKKRCRLKKLALTTRARIWISSQGPHHLSLFNIKKAMAKKERKVVVSSTTRLRWRI